jgi:hypothetical protein
MYVHAVSSLRIACKCRRFTASSRCSGQVTLLRWLLSEDAAQELSRDDTVTLIAAAASYQQYECIWELKGALVSGSDHLSLPPSSSAVVLIAAAQTQHFEEGARIWRALEKNLADEAFADNSLLFEAAIKCLQESGSYEAAHSLYMQLRGKCATVGCSNAAVKACAQLAEWNQVLEIFDSLPDDDKSTCDVATVAHAARRAGGDAAVCKLFFKHFSGGWTGLRDEALCEFLPSLHAQNYSKEVTALLLNLRSKASTGPQAICSCISILADQQQWKDVIDSYFVIKGAGLSISAQVFSCVIHACAEEAVGFATFMTILENARLSNPALSAFDWNNAAIAASHRASSSEMYSLACEAHAAGHSLSAVAAAALLLTTNQRAGAADVVRLLKFVPVPVPKQCIEAAATALVHEDLWNDALAVLEGSSGPLSLQLSQTQDFGIVERCSKFFTMYSIPTDASFTKAALRYRCMHHLSTGDSISAANLIMPALRNHLVDVESCVQVIQALASDADAVESCSRSTTPGTVAGGILQQRQREREAADRAASLRRHAIRIFELAGQVFETIQLGKAVDCIISCMHQQQQPQALIDTLDTYLNIGQKLSDRSYAAAILANETLGMHERALALLNEIQHRHLHLAALRAGSRCKL